MFPTFRQAWNPVFRPPFRFFRQIEPPQQCFALRLDGVNTFIQAQDRLIDPDGDIDIEWYQQGVPATGGRTILTQADSATISNRELLLRWINGNMDFSVGGTSVITLSNGVAISNGKWRVTMIGNVVSAYLNNVLVFTNNRVRGAAREPVAPTRLGVRFNAGTPAEFFQGILAWVRINNAYYPLDARNQAIQLARPDGLGAELRPSNGAPLPFTVVNSGNFAIAYASGTQSPQLAAGTYLVDLDIEVTSGSFRVRLNNQLNFLNVSVQSRKLVRAITTVDESANRFDIQSTIAGSSCVIHEFRAYRLDGTAANPLTINNFVESQWEPFACR
jgi:hypothetical protein